MKSIFIFILLFLNSIMISQTYYKGLEKMCWKNKNGIIECYDSPRKWYNENTLLLTNDSVFIYKTPLQIIKNKKLYSSSDGGFKYFFGKLIKKSNDTIAYLTMHNCDYCANQVRIDSATGYYYPIPKEDSLKFSKKLNKIIIGDVKYYKIKKKDKINFPSKSRFYFDSTSISRKNPLKQFSLISKSIEDFYKTKDLQIDNETLIICTEREDEFGKELEILESEKLDISISGIKIVFYSKSELENIVLKSNIILRYIMIGEIREDFINASVDLSYKILLSKEIRNFSDREYNNFFVYKKNKTRFELINRINKNSWNTIEKK